MDEFAKSLDKLIRLFHKFRFKTNTGQINSYVYDVDGRIFDCLVPLF